MPAFHTRKGVQHLEGERGYSKELFKLPALEMYEAFEAGDMDPTTLLCTLAARGANEKPPSDAEIAGRLIHHPRYPVGADRPNINGEPPLVCAANSGNVVMATLLLDNHANIDATDARGITALHSAVLHPKMTQLLLDRGANPKLTGENGKSAFDRAIEMHQTLTIEIIINAKNPADGEYWYTKADLRTLEEDKRLSNDEIARMLAIRDGAAAPEEDIDAQVERILRAPAYSEDDPLGPGRDPHYSRSRNAGRRDTLGVRTEIYRSAAARLNQRSLVLD